MADIQTGRWGRIVQAAFNLKQSLTLGQAMPDVLPVFDLTNPDQSLRFHANDDYASGTTPVSAVAAQYGQAALQLPASSGRIVVVERIAISVNANAGFQITMGGASGLYGSAVTPYTQFSDSRRTGRPVSTMRASSGAALNPNPGFLVYGDANRTVTVDGPWIMSQTPVGGLPSPFILVECNVVNTAFYCAWRFRERTMEPAEYRVS